MYINLIFSTNKKDKKLKAAILEDEKTRWKRISKSVGKSDVGCQRRAKQIGLSK